MERKQYIKWLVLTDFIRKNETASEGDKEKQQERAKLYGISPKLSGHITKPKQFEHIPDDLFGDPVNYKYPIDVEHVIVAVRYFNHKGQREAGGYTEKEWEIIGNRIASKTNGKYVYKDGKLVKGEA